MKILFFFFVILMKWYLKGHWKRGFFPTTIPSAFLMFVSNYAILRVFGTSRNAPICPSELHFSCGISLVVRFKYWTHLSFNASDIFFFTKDLFVSRTFYGLPNLKPVWSLCFGTGFFSLLPVREIWFSISVVYFACAQKKSNIYLYCQEEKDSKRERRERKKTKRSFCGF